MLLTSEERKLLQSVLNEVLNGFALPDIGNVIGMKESELRELLARLYNLGNGAALELDTFQIIAFRNALKETLLELGTEEFSTRTGCDFNDGEKTLQTLNGLIGVP